MIEIRELSTQPQWHLASFCYRRPERAEAYTDGDEVRFEEAIGGDTAS
jgi:hypothetical protein